MQKINTIGNNIRKVRDLKGLSQENVAISLGITQLSYARLEKDDDRITITRLKQISIILQTSVAELINEKTAKIITQQNNENAYVDVIINADKSHIETLKNEIAFLHELLKKNNK